MIEGSYGDMDLFYLLVRTLASLERSRELSFPKEGMLDDLLTSKWDPLDGGD